MKCNNCVYCKRQIEYRPPNMFFENEEDRFLCGVCIDAMSPEEDLDESYFVELSELDSIVYNNGRTPPRFIE